MSKIEITQREMDRAFRSHHAATQQLPSSVNPSKLVCLFYAVECGLKSLIMKQERHQTTNGIEIHNFKHDINKMLEYLKSGAELRLPTKRIHLAGKSDVSRDTFQSELNQVWRYGADINDKGDHTRITTTLENICAWIKEQR
ncbi:hypothetical protein J7438_04915 [Thalassotalea sp. G20_0]|uniref:hypothetical protein n=1 Tax=Thalassotalea sp. G20_0 TaxID=2821093 RepID=UPI001AD9C666|nr:hypothetical protein [Thalassotalea sp. G20_0]MBO9493427.1 hypothetical protein [Thalassotalea sp. G20_0]